MQVVQATSREYSVPHHPQTSGCRRFCSFDNDVDGPALTLTFRTTTMGEGKEYTLEEVAKHTNSDSCWLIIGNASNGA